MIDSFTWHAVGVLIFNGFFFGLGWLLIQAIYGAILWTLNRRPPQP